MSIKNDEPSRGSGPVISALAMTLDQHFPGFLEDFEQNCARIHDLMDDRNVNDQELRNAGSCAREVERDDLNHAYRRGER